MSKKTITTLIIIIAVAVGFSVFRIFQGVPIFGPSVSTIRQQARVVGIIFPRQHIDAVKGFKEGFKEMGYTNITFIEKEMHTSSPTLSQDIVQAAQELVSSNVDLVFATQENIAVSAIKVTKDEGSDIPIVFTARFHDPVEYGVVDSFRSSGNNATGVSINLVEVIQKQFDFLKELDPTVKTIGVFGEGFVVPEVGGEFLREVKTQADRFGINVVEYKTAVPPPQAEAAFREIAGKIRQGEIDAIYHIAGHFFEPQEAAESELAIRLKIPMIAPVEDMQNGGHFGYAGDMVSSGKQTARMADKIFGGAKPSDIPIEYEERNVLILNLKRAMESGFTFPESMLFIADEIEE